VRAERRLLRAGEYLVARACRRLPPEVRDERCREWAAELPVILHDRQVRFAPWRAVRMLGYAADTLRGAAMTPGKTPGAIRRPYVLLFLVICLVSAAANTWAIVQAPEDGQYYLGLTWSLLFAAYFIGCLAHAPERMSTVLLFSAALALEVLMVWQVVQAPRDWVNYFQAAELGLALLAGLLFVLRVRWFRRLLARARRA